ncbi:hypothetical protein AGMMS50222_02160 [Endomicrobiia bacterium]|nr:hypothetical protein AGMMS49531_02220 [Endomicrobiia bacterium]GHT64243.1 hypothetical protein AGMMS49556_02020 [Endomicrobiia bacterium]GHT73901.1 hypothetical protein AGMMS50222_02160 [Endomicrobiia bacterium]
MYAWRLVDSSEPGLYGFGISADQAINRNFGLFLRAGSNDLSYDNYIGNNRAIAILKPLKTWSFGIQLKAAEWSTTGIAVGQLFHDGKIPNYAKGRGSFRNVGEEESNYETCIEVYEKIALNDNFTITPSLQYVSDNSMSQEITSQKRFIYGIRIAFHF